MEPRRRLLLVEDDRLQQRLVAQVLLRFRGEPFDLDAVPTAREGLERLLSGRYAAAIFDYVLPDGDGLALLRSARDQGCQTPVIFLTGNSGNDLDLAALDAGAADYLEKAHLSPRSLERALRYALRLADSLAQLRELATRDGLTGLLNRREFDRLLAAELERGARFRHPLSVALVDLDRFKRINDEHGHAAGDTVLREVGRLLAGSVRSVDFVARFGGEELAIIFVETWESEAQAMLQRIADDLGRHPIEHEQRLIPVTFSAGIASVPPYGADPAALLAAADTALYRAKQSGRNRIEVASANRGETRPAATEAPRNPADHHGAGI